MTINVLGYAARAATEPLAPFQFERHAPRADDVVIDIPIEEMLDFCGHHGITSDIEVIDIEHINEAYERMLRSDVKYRFVMDMASLRKDQQ
jgi:D-arabinose 1-dehydrogenase-like Zn-dependent alcohol dehydrogenase